jgi:predicted transcriptional regulator
MQSAKKTVQALLDTLPDDCSVEDVLYHLYVIDKVERGLADVTAGRTMSHEAVAQKLRRKWTTGRES